MDNDDYHAIPALSSSKLKKFAQSPAPCLSRVCAPLSRAKSASTATAFATGTVSHGLILSPSAAPTSTGITSSPIRLPTGAAYCVADPQGRHREAWLKPGRARSNPGLIEQLLAADPAMADQIFDVLAHEHLDEAVPQARFAVDEAQPG